MLNRYVGYISLSKINTQYILGIIPSAPLQFHLYTELACWIAFLIFQCPGCFCFMYATIQILFSSSRVITLNWLLNLLEIMYDWFLLKRLILPGETWRGIRVVAVSKPELCIPC
jgi:hypothetical protein